MHFVLTGYQSFLTFSPPAAAQKLHPDLSLPNVSSVSLSAEEKAMAACCGGNIPALQALLQAGVSINHTSGNTSSNLLHMAAYCGQVGQACLCCYLHCFCQVDYSQATIPV